MKVLIGYATKEGQTRKIARHILDMAVDAGHAVELLGLEDAEDIDLGRFDRVLLAAPIHVGHYPKALVSFVSNNVDRLRQIQIHFISVSLAAAGQLADDWKGLDKIVADLTTATGWSPVEVKHVAGAYMPSKYDILTGFIMARIVSSSDPGINTSQDKVYTDWSDLNAWLKGWLKPKQ